MYLEQNSIFRAKINSESFMYQGSQLPVYYSGQWEDDDGAHIRILVHVNEPTSTEVGFDAARNLTGFIQIGLFLPSTDRGLDYSLNELASQIDVAFKRQSFVDGNFKVQWLGTTKGDEVRILGHYTATVLVNFSNFTCL